MGKDDLWNFVGAGVVRMRGGDPCGRPRTLSILHDRVPQDDGDSTTSIPSLRPAHPLRDSRPTLNLMPIGWYRFIGPSHSFSMLKYTTQHTVGTYKLYHVMLSVSATSSDFVLRLEQPFVLILLFDIIIEQKRVNHV